MKYTLLFAATAAAYDAYGGYGSQQSSSAPAKMSSSAPSYSGYVYQSVTSQASTPPASKATPCSTSVGKDGYTTVVPGYGKPPVTVTTQHQSYPTCVAKGYDGKSCDKWEDDKYVSTTITDYNKKVVTVTKVQDYVTVYHEKKTITHYATSTIGGYGAVSTASVNKNATGNWYELYEKVHVVDYQNMGKNALVGYSGSGLCQKCDNAQPIVVKEYKGGKWTEEKTILNYGKPQNEVKVYEKPGVYTIPAKVVTVYSSTPTGKAPEYGIYHYDAKVITITKSNQPYTCTYDLPKQTPSKTPTYNDYGYKASATPKKTENYYPSYPSYPIKSNTTSYGNGYAEKPTTTPCTSSKAVYGDNGYGAKSTPTSASSMPVYGDYSYGDKSTPSLNSYPTPTPPAYGNGGYSDNSKPSTSVPSKPSSTPCDDDKKNIPTPTPSKPVQNDDNYRPSPTPPTQSKPVYENNNNNGYGDNSKPNSTPAYPAYPADPSGGYSSNVEYGKTSTGYTKRGGMIERRKAVAEEQISKRAIVL
ncbi:hypothetical protein BDU57DRAFT_536329 [Ampelomyces quisqualis]|uniref:Uncharacterized protein n=1 Tax=Ampelomyces quisqualis TaxID=50730 RepID=A0A6A5QU64_AMPQU|nr:hypothetical protein BDU57DRAFT_536329 [Ampelomyces quisqualis]